MGLNGLRCLYMVMILLFTAAVSIAQPNTSFFVNDAKQYDSAFIAVQKEYNGDVKLIDSLIVLGTDILLIPQVLKSNSMHIFLSGYNDEYWKLVLTKLNQTQVRYTLMIKDKDGKMIEGIRGVASLDPYFATNIMHETVDGHYYTCFEYRDTTKYCITTIRVGYDLNDEQKIRARISFICQDPKRRKVDFEHTPLLISEQ